MVRRGIDGSSPSEGFCKSPGNEAFYSQVDLQPVGYAVGAEPFMEPSAQKLRAVEPAFALDALRAWTQAHQSALLLAHVAYGAIVGGFISLAS
jgi:hypothetical protein